MGQANSRGSSDARPRNRPRPNSWAPSLGPPPQPASDSVPEGLRPRLSSSRPASSQRFNPLSILSTHQEHADAASRARSSLTSIPSLFHRRSSSRSTEHSDSLYVSPPSSAFPSASHPALRHTTNSGYERGAFLPRVQLPELDLNFDELSNQRAEHAHAPGPRLIPARRDGRASSLLPSFRPDIGLRSMTSQLPAMLSRLLSVAAAATAASLMGDDHRAVSEARNVAGDGEDGTFDSFLQALQNGRIASALRQTGSDNDEGDQAPGSSPAPLNFFRMFRFGSSTSDQGHDTRSGSGGGGPGSPGNQVGEEEGDGRMVPIIIVGIRSINPGTGVPQDDNIPPFLDALSSFPTPLASPGENTIDGTLRQPQNSTRFSHRRRASMGGVNTFPSNYDNQRHYRAPDRPRPWSTFTDSPSGPLPPPTTPASSGLSAVSSGTTTPNISTSPPSPTIQSSGPSRRESFIRRAAGAGLEPTVEEPQPHHRTPRQRRLSESDFTRFGSGASRRNGVVEPDHNPGEGSRSWIIYVLGGSYPENHPILTTPSLFTDSPTYEDMLLLSTLLGPAKPPVASEADVAAAPGLFRIRVLSGTMVAEAVGGTEIVSLECEARCLVCLCNFEVDEEARRLINCGHLFHKLCIDQWLTTGRNSCPLCRGQGVDEKATDRALRTDPPDVAGASYL
ncbi:hypothetical protein BDV95DRAFT_625343 [Massariosphaeria phaeospora]|uniref:RING-type domain-containing protein n=1 Tax=Massariosphaeria phaeospora TaxID=100035 RepID=A0A7C8IH33_9PLEO|nr:hypothetical protein BDV95DRAFT_625343 [Massariosphaeria phaeospora]